MLTIGSVPVIFRAMTDASKVRARAMEMLLSAEGFNGMTAGEIAACNRQGHGWTIRNAAGVALLRAKKELGFRTTIGESEKMIRDVVSVLKDRARRFRAVGGYIPALEAEVRALRARVAFLERSQPAPDLPEMSADARAAMKLCEEAWDPVTWRPA